MAFATIDDVKEHAIFKDEIATLTDPHIQRLISRAERVVTSMTGSAFAAETDVNVLFDLNVATVYMVDKLFTMTRPDNAEDAIVGLQSEKILERSHTLSKDKLFATHQFEEEFQSIIAGLRKRVGVRPPIFRIGRGPSYRGDESCD